MTVFTHIETDTGTNVDISAATAVGAYTSVSGDIDSVGTWQIQGYVETSLGKFWTEKDSFKVYSTLATA